MKKRKLLGYLAISFLLAGCGANNASTDSNTVTPEVTVTSIEFSNEEGIIKTYHVNDPFIRPSVVANLSDGSKADITDYVLVEGFNSRKTGEQTVVITYDSFTLSYQVNVINLIKELSISGQRTSFELGDEFEFGGIVNAIYDDGTVYNITEKKKKLRYKMSKESTTTVTVKYDMLTVSYEITVTAKSEKVVSSLSLGETKTEYKQGDDFVRPVVTATYDDESTEDVSDKASISCYDLSNSGTYTVTVEYKGASVTYEIEVKQAEGNIDDIDEDEDTISKAFSLTTSNGAEPTVEGNVYTITAAGKYVAKGKLSEGQIVVDAEEAEVEISLEGVSVSNSSDSPIYIKTCDKVEISAKKNTNNYVYDMRQVSTNDEDVTGAAIFAEDGDLKIKGKGTLVVTSLANNGIHGKDDVTIKNATLIIKALNNGIKGNDSVTIEEYPNIDIVCGNDGIKTSNTDLSSKGNQRGIVAITGGNIKINSYADGIDAAYNVEITDGVIEDDSGENVATSPVIDIYTNIYSSYNSANLSEGITERTVLTRGNNNKAADSAKGIKAPNLVSISGGTTYIKAYDDGIHGNKTSGNTQIAFDNGGKATGDVSISGGSVTTYVSDDGVHADGTLDISGGEITVSNSYEGLEGNIISVTGGNATVYATNDGINATSSINVSGGYLDVTVSPNGDTDGIDSNGTITVTGGTVITRGPNNMNMSPLDADGTITINGGTVVVIGRNMSSSGGGGHWSNTRAPGGWNPGGPGGQGGGTISVGSGVTTTTSTTGGSKGNHTITFANSDEIISYTNSYTYSNYVTVYSVNGTATIK